MKSFLLFLIVLVPTCLLAQQDSVFIVSEKPLASELSSEIENLRKQKLPLYEDENYLVSGTCSGEWGGSVWFKRKRDGVEFAASATCPVSVNKLNGKYYVACSLAHMQGSCGVLEIENPELMEIFKVPPRKWVKGKRVRYVGDDQSHSTKGTVNKIGEFGRLILGSFVFNNELLYVVCDRRQSGRSTPPERKTFVAKIEANEFVLLQTITTEDLFTYNNDSVHLDNGHLMIPVSIGYLDIFQNNITILRR